MKTLSNWLLHLEKIHPLSMDFKLERIKTVFKRLNIDSIAPIVITVAGTNGKGSTSTTIAAILNSMGIKIGLYNSPHIHQFNERISINGCYASDKDIIEAFELIEKTRDEITLTYFEFATLAAFYLFYKNKVQVAVLEVGLGGRLDATNIVDADIAVITPIDIDHTELLGSTIEAIAQEKAGIIKKKSIVISAEIEPPLAIQQKVKSYNNPFYHLGKDFNFFIENSPNANWTFHNREIEFKLCAPKLQGSHQYQNTATAIEAVLNTPFGRDLTDAVINQAISTLILKGRFDTYQTPDNQRIIFDVTHNAQGANVLRDLLAPYKNNNSKITAVFGMLKDKDCNQVGHILNPIIDNWVLCPLSGERGQSSLELSEKLEMLPKSNIHHASSVANGCEKALNTVTNNDIIIIFGSFHTVSEGYDWYNTRFGL